MFTRLLISFLALIFLATSFNFLSFAYFKTNINEETIKYNKLNLNNTVQNFEEYLTQLRNTVLSMYFNDKLKHFNDQIVKKEKLDYLAADQLYQEINSTLLSEPMKYVHNLFYFLDSYKVIIDKEGMHDIETMFNRFYQNETFHPDFWRNQFDNGKQFAIYPSSTFRVRGTTLSSTDMQLIPLVIKGSYSSNNASKNAFWAALIHTEEMIANLHLSINQNLIILDKDQNVIFSSQPEKEWNPVQPLEGSGHFTEEEKYYFYKKGEFTDFTYINVIPYANMTAKVKKMNLLLLSLLLVCILISTILSIFFSIRFNKPIQRILESIGGSRDHEPGYRSTINEFELIRHNMHRMFMSNQDMSKVLEKRNSLLRNYAFTNRVKNINTNFQEIRELSLVKSPYRLALFDITLQPTNSIEKEAAINSIRELINRFWLEVQSDSLTFQVENNQVLTLLFVQENDKQGDRLLRGLKDLKKIFAFDKDTVFFTMCLSPVYHSASELNRAYNDVQQLAMQRRLNADTQIITEREAEKRSFILTPNQEQEFRVHLLEGNEGAVIHWVQKNLNYMQKKEAVAVQYKEFADNIVTKVQQTLYSLQLDEGSLLDYIKPFEACHTLEEYHERFHVFLKHATSLIHQKKNDHDHITSFVMDYVEEHYSEDISLEIMGAKLNITGGYLSSYFKEKTGMNFSEYINALRIDKAKQFLQNTDIKIHEVANKVGYFNVNSFIRMFKKIVGITPGEYRKKFIHAEEDVRNKEKQPAHRPTALEGFYVSLQDDSD